MRVLLTHERFPPDFGGGGEYIVLGTARALRRQGVDVEVLTTGDPSVREFDGIRTARLPVSRYRMNLAARTIARRAADADVIQTFSYHACLPSFLAGKIGGKPVVCMALALFGRAWHEMKPFPAGHAWERWERFLIRLPYARVVFISDYSRRDGAALGVPAARSVVHYPGLESGQFVPIWPKTDRVLFAAKFDVRKGLPDLLDVARALPEVPFTAMGWGQGPAVEAFQRGAPPNLTIVFEPSPERLRRAYGEARIFFLPTKAETLGMSLIEAMAAGCAVVSTMPLPYEGALVSPGDVPAMIAAIRALWNDRTRSDAAGHRNVELARAYTWEAYGQGLLGTYDQVRREFADSQRRAGWA